MNEKMSIIAALAEKDAAAILSRWQQLLKDSGASGGGKIKDGELQTQCRDFLAALNRAMAAGAEEIQDPAFDTARTLLEEVTRSRAVQGFTPTETATFVFSLKEPLFERLRATYPDDAATVADAGWQMTQLIDQLGLYTMEIYQKSREEVVRRQQDEIAELSTPVVKLWEGISRCR